MPKQRAAGAPSTETESTTHGHADRTVPVASSLSPPSDTPQTSSSSSTPDRSGTDARQRGWYWHWNGIVTQYAPLIGLKGVGLLNSYTVWTDRRDQSPTRGYAFPSQQSEAAFYGEDRAELITINKILVALDLIEIRKEMVLRTDPQGRRWKVPHNLYRVKDRPEGIELRTEDVLRVVELASRDAAVYRYVKRMFSSRFAPIDRENVWHRILEEIADNPTWQQLTEKTARTEAKASARTRAGHKSRNKMELPADDDTVLVAEMTTGHFHDIVLHAHEHNDKANRQNGTSVAFTNNGSSTKNSDVASGNNGSEPDVDLINTGSQGGDESSAEATNNGPASVVERSNATYYQETSTTTTTTNRPEFAGDNFREPDQPVADAATSAPPEIEQRDENTFPESPRPDGLDDDPAAVPPTATSTADATGRRPSERRLADPGAGGPLVDPGPLVVSLFEAANNRAASPLERILLGELERDAAVPAGRVGETGADWVAAALREAVSSGSSFVAPKRIREIINRWAAVGARPGADPPPAPDTGIASQTSGNVRLPHGRSPRKVWDQVLNELAAVLDSASIDRLFTGSSISGYHRGTVRIEVAADAAPKLAAEYRPLLQRHLQRHIGRDMEVEIAPAHEAAAPDPPPVQKVDVMISSADAEQGRQLWRAVMAELRQQVRADDLARLGRSLPIGQDAGGRIVVGASSSLAGGLIEGRCREAVETALSLVLGSDVKITIALPGQWAIEDNEAT
jgi:hypothetical protein